MVTSNRTLDVGSLCLEKRQPFGFMAEGLSTSFGRGDCRNFEPSALLKTLIEALQSIDVKALECFEPLVAVGR